MQKYTCRCSWHALKFSPLRLVSSLWLSGYFVLSYAIHFWVYLSQPEVEWTNLASQNHNFVLPHSKLKRMYCKMTWSEYSACEPISISRLPTCDQSAPQESWFATPTKKDSNDNKNKPSRIWDPTFGLGRVNIIVLKCANVWQL